jgi:hypothetical protein
VTGVEGYEPMFDLAALAEAFGGLVDPAPLGAGDEWLPRDGQLDRGGAAVKAPFRRRMRERWLPYVVGRGVAEQIRRGGTGRRLV